MTLQINVTNELIQSTTVEDFAGNNCAIAKAVTLALFRNNIPFTKLRMGVTFVSLHEGQHISLPDAVTKWNAEATMSENPHQVLKPISFELEI